MRISATIPDHAALVTAVMEGFVQAAQMQIQAGIVPPFPTMARVRFIEEPAGSEEWLLPNQVIAAGGGDCEDLCFWEAAGCRLTIDPGARCQIVQNPNAKAKDQLHCIVVMSDGSTRDPALMLRMQEVQSKRPRRRSSLGAGVTVTDHRGEGQRKPTTAPPAAAPTGVPQPGTFANKGKEGSILDYMKKHGLKEFTGSTQVNAPTQGFDTSWGTVNVPTGVVDPRILNALASEGPGAAGGAALRATGKGKRTVVEDPEGAGFVLVQGDDGTVFYTRGSELQRAAWEQGMDPDEFRQALQEQQALDEYYAQYGEFGFPGGYSELDAFGGFPYGFGYEWSGGVAPYPDSFDTVDPAAFYGDEVAAELAGGDDAQSGEELGVDVENAIDAESEEVD